MSEIDHALKYLAANDSVLARLIDQYQKPVFTRHTQYYQELVSSIISQQLSVKAARAIETRFKDLFGGVFPAPKQLVLQDIETLRAIGISRPKARYIHDLASKIIDGAVQFDNFDELSNDAIIAELTQVKGIGVWTAHMFLMFCMARLDVLPTGDLGIRNGVGRLYGFESVPTEREVELVAEQHEWQPYASVASWYIWQSLDNAPK